MDEIIREIKNLEEIPAVRTAYFTTIIEENLTRRPYAKHLTQVVLEGELASHFDLTKVTLECLKNMTNEDFMQLFIIDAINMAEYSSKYQNIHGNAYENELAKLMLRYNNEGRSSVAEQAQK